MSTESRTMKPSIFNIEVPYHEDRMLFNTVSSLVLRLNERQHELIRACLGEIENSGTCENREMLELMSSHHFIVPREEDEYGREHEKFLRNKCGSDRALFIIAPTMSCNLSCDYCFQKNAEKAAVMTPDIQKGVVDFFLEKTRQSRIAIVQWFGGEPLLALKTIQQLSGQFKEICARGGIEYYSEMLTNGVLLSRDSVKHLEDLSIKALQLTLDGRPETFSRRKGMPLKSAEAYYRFLLDHLQAIVDAVGSVTIRINVDRDNIDEAKDVVGMFRQQRITDRRIDFRLGFLNTRRGDLSCIPRDCFSENEFSDRELDFKYFLAREGYYVYDFPTPIGHPCAASDTCSYTIDPLGRIGKCVPDMCHRGSSYTRIYPDDMKRTFEEADMPNAPFRDYDPFTIPRCLGCAFLPVCLGECPRQHSLGLDFNCRLKLNCAGMLNFYDRFQRTKLPLQ